MTLQQRIESAVREAVLARDALRTSVLRLALSAAHNRRIELGRPLDDSELLDTLGREAKQRRESIEQFRAGGRGDLADREEAELRILAEFMPEPMSPDELERLARETIDAVGATGPKDMGRVMGELTPRIRGRADGRAAADAVRRLLADGGGADGESRPAPRGDEGGR